LALLFGLFYLDISPLSKIVNSTQIDLISDTLKLLLDNIEGNKIIITPHYNLIIEKNCNGLMVYFLFIATILATNISFKDKLIWITIGYITITVVNILRIYLITKFVLIDKSNFYLAHNIFGNLLLFFTSIGLFFIFITYRKRV
jgi:exosortase/archaeosortase family protein